jgi:hypothetical protein
MDDILERFARIADIGHLALFLWAFGASVTCHRLLRDLSSANRRFDDFVRELARFNRRTHKGDTA